MFGCVTQKQPISVCCAHVDENHVCTELNDSKYSITDSSCLNDVCYGSITLENNQYDITFPVCKSEKNSCGNIGCSVLEWLSTKQMHNYDSADYFKLVQIFNYSFNKIPSPRGFTIGLLENEIRKTISSTDNNVDFDSNYKEHFRVGFSNISMYYIFNNYFPLNSYAYQIYPFSGIHVYSNYLPIDKDCNSNGKFIIKRVNGKTYLFTDYIACREFNDKFNIYNNNVFDVKTALYGLALGANHARNKNDYKFIGWQLHREPSAYYFYDLVLNFYSAYFNEKDSNYPKEYHDNFHYYGSPINIFKKYGYPFECTSSTDCLSGVCNKELYNRFACYTNDGDSSSIECGCIPFGFVQQNYINLDDIQNVFHIPENMICVPVNREKRNLTTEFRIDGIDNSWTFEDDYPPMLNWKFKLIAHEVPWIMEGTCSLGHYMAKIEYSCPFSFDLNKDFEPNISPPLTNTVYRIITIDPTDYSLQGNSPVIKDENVIHTTPFLKNCLYTNDEITYDDFAYVCINPFIKKINTNDPFILYLQSLKNPIMVFAKNKDKAYLDAEKICGSKEYLEKIFNIKISDNGDITINKGHKTFLFALITKDADEDGRFGRCELNSLVSFGWCENKQIDMFEQDITTTNDYTYFPYIMYDPPLGILDKIEDSNNNIFLNYPLKSFVDIDHKIEVNDKNICDNSNSIAGMFLSSGDYLSKLTSNLFYGCSAAKKYYNKLPNTYPDFYYLKTQIEKGMMNNIMPILLFEKDSIKDKTMRYFILRDIVQHMADYDSIEYGILNITNIHDPKTYSLGAALILFEKDLSPSTYKEYIHLAKEEENGCPTCLGGLYLTYDSNILNKLNSYFNNNHKYCFRDDARFNGNVFNPILNTNIEGTVCDKDLMELVDVIVLDVDSSKVNSEENLNILEQNTAMALFYYGKPTLLYIKGKDVKDITNLLAKNITKLIESGIIGVNYANPSINEENIKAINKLLQARAFILNSNKIVMKSYFNPSVEIEKPNNLPDPSQIKNPNNCLTDEELSNLKFICVYSDGEKREFSPEELLNNFDKYKNEIASISQNVGLICKIVKNNNQIQWDKSYTYVLYPTNSGFPVDVSFDETLNKSCVKPNIALNPEPFNNVFCVGVKQ